MANNVDKATIAGNNGGSFEIMVLAKRDPLAIVIAKSKPDSLE